MLQDRQIFANHSPGSKTSSALVTAAGSFKIKTGPQTATATTPNTPALGNGSTQYPKSKQRPRSKPGRNTPSKTTAGKSIGNSVTHGSTCTVPKHPHDPNPAIAL